MMMRTQTTWRDSRTCLNISCEKLVLVLFLGHFFKKKSIFSFYFCKSVFLHLPFFVLKDRKLKRRWSIYIKNWFGFNKFAHVHSLLALIDFAFDYFLVALAIHLLRLVHFIYFKIIIILILRFQVYIFFIGEGLRTKFSDNLGA